MIKLSDVKVRAQYRTRCVIAWSCWSMPASAEPRPRVGTMASVPARFGRWRDRSRRRGIEGLVPTYPWPRRVSPPATEFIRHAHGKPWGFSFTRPYTGERKDLARSVRVSA
jgi:hypothetical protein